MTITSVFMATALARVSLFHFILTDDSGQTFTKLWIKPHSQEAWGKDYLHGKPLQTSESLTVFGNGATGAQWDLRVQYGKRYEVFENLELPKLKKVTILINEGKWDAHFEE